MSAFNTQLWGGGAGEPIGTAYSVRNLGYQVLRLLGVLRPGMTPSEDWMADCLFHANLMMDGFNAERLKIHAISRNTHTLTASVQTYTLGLGGNFDQVRPPKIEAVAVLDASGNEMRLYPIGIELKMRGARGFYTDGAYPLANLWISHLPASGEQIAIYGWEPLAAFADLETVYAFPEGYGLMILYGLTAQIIPAARISHKIEVSQVAFDSISAQAREYKQRVQSMNAPILTIRADPALINIGRGGWC